MLASEAAGRTSPPAVPVRQSCFQLMFPKMAAVRVGRGAVLAAPWAALSGGRDSRHPRHGLESGLVLLAPSFWPPVGDATGGPFFCSESMDDTHPHTPALALCMGRGRHQQGLPRMGRQRVKPDPSWAAQGKASALSGWACHSFIWTSRQEAFLTGGGLISTGSGGRDGAGEPSMLSGERLSRCRWIE